MARGDRVEGRGAPLHVAGVALEQFDVCACTVDGIGELARCRAIAVEARIDVAARHRQRGGKLRAKPAASSADEHDSTAEAARVRREVRGERCGPRHDRAESDVLAHVARRDWLAVVGCHIEPQIENPEVRIEAGDPRSIEQDRGVLPDILEVQRQARKERPEPRQFHAHQVAAERQHARLYRRKAAIRFRDRARLVTRGNLVAGPEVVHVEDRR